MGIRVHKAIGYGIDNLVKNDPRVDMGKLQDFCNEELGLKDFLKFVKANKEAIIEACISEEGDRKGAEHAYSWFKLLENDKSLKFENFNSIIHDDEYGYEQVLLLIPPGMVKSWHRYNDSIDWAFETNSHQQEKHYEFLKEPLYPYDYKYVHIPGKPEFSVEELKEKCGYMGRNTLTDSTRVITSTVINGAGWGSKFAKKLRGAYRPALPAELIAFMLWSGAFTDLEQMKNDLRAMHLVYWA